MLKSELLHPEILSTLARNGHGSKILIADGNFPFETKAHPQAKQVFLNLSPGVVGCLDVLKPICSVVPIESALVMDPPESGEFAVNAPDIWGDFSKILEQSGNSIQLDRVGRFNFYECCASADVKLVVATAEQRIFANLLLTIGVVQ